MKRTTNRPRGAAMRAKATQRRTSKPKPSSPRTSREKVEAHRARLRAKGLRPVQMWLPDTRSAEFAAEARRQCLLANSSPFAAEDQAWVDAMSYRDRA
jgi:hypothetical protein